MSKKRDAVWHALTKTKGEAFRGVVILIVGFFTLVASVITARDHLEAKLPRASEVVGATTAVRAQYDEKPTRAYDRFPIAPSGSIGSIDEARGTPSRIIVRGWIVNPYRKLAQHVFAIVDHRYRYEVTRGYGNPRPDVAVYLNQPELRDAGVVTSLSSIGLSKGAHRLTLAVFLEGNNALYPIGSTIGFYVR